MHTRILTRNILVMFLCFTLALSGCATTTQLQTKYTTFDTCFSQEKKDAMMIGALPGALLGIGAALNNNKQGMVAGAALSVVGAIIGNKVAWQRCLTAFPVKV
jgi:uncharacterized membrane protein